MSKWWSSMGLLVVAMPALASATCEQRSEALLTALKADNYQAATADFAPQMKAALSADKLTQIWSDMLPLQFGPYDADAKGQVPKAKSATQIVTPLHFARAWLNMVVACNADDKIAGLNFVPGSAPPGAKANPPQAKVTGTWGVSKPTHVESALGPLPATLTLPQGQGPFPVVVLVGGSGAHDRDEAIGPNKPFLDIARGLAAAGVASLRYDKRTYTYPSKIAGSENFTIDDEVTDDVLSAVQQLGQTESIDPKRVFVLGHSLGAMMAPRIGKRDPKLAGLILMAAPARPLLDVSAQQVREQGQRGGASKADIATSEAAIDAKRKLLAEADPKQPPKGSFAGAPQSYWLSLHGYDQVAVARSLSMPMLVLQGGADFQVSPTEDFARWKKVLKDHKHVVFHLYLHLSHLFMPAGKTQTVADYKEPGHVAGQVIGDIAAWIKAQHAR